MKTQSELIPIKFHKVMQSKSYSVVVLGTDEKKFAIYTEPNSGRTLQLYLTETEKERPYTHDLIDRMFRGLEIRVKQIVINDLQDTTYFARLFLEQNIADVLHIVEIDARPSDCIALALLYKCPLYCTEEVFSRVLPIEGS